MVSIAMSKIVIVGGGTAGWMAAAALSKMLGQRRYSITLVESDEIGTVGVGEATIPAIQMFNDLLDLDEGEFVRETQATFKIGIEFKDWSQIGHSYFHPFGLFGVDMNGIEFSNYWMRFARMGGGLDYGRFNLETVAARSGLFAKTPDDRSGAPKMHYAYQFDAGLYAKFLRRYAEKRGVRRIEGRIVAAEKDSTFGQITAVQIASGQSIAGDLFVDCSGFKGLLIQKELGIGFEDWSDFLPCDRAVAVPCERSQGPLQPFTTATAREAGWQWRIPLQHRTGNGYVYCKDFISDDEAAGKLLSRLDGKPLRDPIQLRFRAGRIERCWEKNVVSIGLSSGFLEPLESTSIHLIQMAITKLLLYFPSNQLSPLKIDRFNAEMKDQYDGVRDFLIAHYHLTERTDSPFWKANRERPVPASLQEKLAWFRETSVVPVESCELFKQSSWFAVLLGQGFLPEGYHPIADTLPEDELRLRLSRIRTLIQERLASMPSHQEFVQRHYAAPEVVRPGRADVSP